MQITPSVNRRQFLSSLFSVGVAGFLSRGNIVSTNLCQAEHTLRLNALIRVLQEHHMLHDDVLHDEQKANLMYAFEKIKPQNHVEEAIAVACSLSHQPACHIVDEYVRRRNGGASFLPDHPVMILKSWGVPDTYRMLIFREQVYAFVAELTEMYHVRGGEVAYVHMQSMVHNWTDSPSGKYSGLDLKERKVIYDAMRFYSPSAQRYSWCSSMVSRAEAL